MTAPLLDHYSAPSALGRLLDEKAAELCPSMVTSGLPPHLWEQALFAPIRDILDRPAKAFRARLAEAGWRLVVGGRQPPSELGAALEILHAGALVVDDIEDGSLERRGGPAIHRVFGVPRALNAGNFMYFWALDLLARLKVSPEASRLLSRQALSTMLACHRGQALDLSLGVGKARREEVAAVVEETTALKTGALASFSVFAGVCAGGGDEMARSAALRFGMSFGIALQKLDDLGNLTSGHAPGKRHEDLRAGRLTWPWVWATERLDGRAFSRLQSMSRSLQTAAAGAHDDTGELERQAEALAEILRGHAGSQRRPAIAGELFAALSELERVFGRSDATRALADDVGRLQESYG